MAPIGQARCATWPMKAVCRGAATPAIQPTASAPRDPFFDKPYEPAAVAAQKPHRPGRPLRRARVCAAISGQHQAQAQGRRAVQVARYRVGVGPMSALAGFLRLLALDLNQLLLRCRLPLPSCRALKAPPQTQPVSSASTSSRPSQPRVDQWPKATVTSAVWRPGTSNHGR